MIGRLVNQFEDKVMAQSLSEGEVFNYTTTGAVANGELRVINRMVGVALNSASGSGQKIAIALEGVFSVAAVATGAKTAGNRVFYRTTGSQFKAAFASGVATGGKHTIGTVWETATAASTTCKVKLIGGPMGVLA